MKFVDKKRKESSVYIFINRGCCKKNKGGNKTLGRHVGEWFTCCGNGEWGRMRLQEKGRKMLDVDILGEWGRCERKREEGRDAKKLL